MLSLSRPIGRPLRRRSYQHVTGARSQRTSMARTLHRRHPRTGWPPRRGCLQAILASGDGGLGQQIAQDDLAHGDLTGPVRGLCCRDRVGCMIPIILS